jgi:hypothetical protein
LDEAAARNKLVRVRILKKRLIINYTTVSVTYQQELEESDPTEGVG